MKCVKIFAYCLSFFLCHVYVASSPFDHLKIFQFLLCQFPVVIQLSPHHTPIYFCSGIIIDKIHHPIFRMCSDTHGTHYGIVFVPMIFLCCLSYIITCTYIHLQYAYYMPILHLWQLPASLNNHKKLYCYPSAFSRKIYMRFSRY